MICMRRHLCRTSDFVFPDEPEPPNRPEPEFPSIGFQVYWGGLF